MSVERHPGVMANKSSWSVSCEFDELVKESDGSGGISGVLAEHIGVSELKTEEVSGGHGISSPGTGSDETIPSVLDGFTELFWEHGGVSLLDDGNSEESNVNELSGKGDVAVHGAFKFSVRHNW